MNFADFILLIAVLLLVLFLLLRPKRKSRALTSSGTSASPKPSHTKQAPTQSKVDLEALAKDRDATLSSFRSEIPPFILKEKLAFERQYSANPGKAFFGQEMSPLFVSAIGSAERMGAQRMSVTRSSNMHLPQI